jgi:hypothetical protein
LIFSKHILNNYLPKLLFICLFVSASHGQYGGGTGTPSDPFLIYTAEQMNTIGLQSEDWDKCFRLMVNIDMGDYTGTAYNIIGNAYGQSFTGVFDGDNHFIINFNYNGNSSYVGLFGYVTYMYGCSPEIKNLILIAPDVNSGTGSYTGALAGYAARGTINNCSVIWGRVSGNTCVGGLVGGCGANISQSCFEGDVSGLSSSGGLIGVIYPNFSIRSCYSKGTVKGGQYTGGLAGRIDCSTGTVYDCYSQSSVSGTSYVGGLIGEQMYGSIYYSYSSGWVTGTDHIGGFIGGYGNPRSVFYCYWDTQSSGQSQSAAGQGKTTQEMHSISTFSSWGGNEGWTIDNGNDYPRLVWEDHPGQLIPAPAYGGGSGTADDPFLIYTPQQLNTIGLIPFHMNMHFKLMADLDLSQYEGTEFNIIGIESIPFTGVFDGNGKKISNFHYSTATGRNYVGLFGDIEDENSVIMNLTLVDPNVFSAAGYYAGALAGVVRQGTVKNCAVEGGIVQGDDCVGGLLGWADGLIDKCYSECAVIANLDAGGLVGAGSRYGKIFNSYTTGSVSAPINTGGLVGTMDGIISDCFASGLVSGNYQVGGMVGQISNGTIANSYTISKVIGLGNVGGFVGGWYDDYPTSHFYGCFWNKTINPSLNGVGSTTPDPNWIMGRTTIEMQTQETFTSQGWDFSYTDGDPADWFIQTDEYPILTWQISPADIYTDGRNNLRDFAVFAKFWMRDDCRRYNNFCDGADLDFNGSVDIDDLFEFMTYWLQSGIYN